MAPTIRRRTRKRAGKKAGAHWVDFIRGEAATWKRLALRGLVPRSVRGWWKVAFDQPDLPLRDLRRHADVYQALIQVLATADEACAGFGVPPSSHRRVSLLKEHAEDLLYVSTWRRCSSSKDGRYSCVGAPCQSTKRPRDLA